MVFRFEKFCVVVVFEMLVHVEPPSVEDSHLTIVPVFPIKVNVPVLLPLQTVVFPEMLPPTVAAFTVIVPKEEFAEAQTPL